MFFVDSFKGIFESVADPGTISHMVGKRISVFAAAVWADVINAAILFLLDHSIAAPARFWGLIDLGLAGHFLSLWIMHLDMNMRRLIDLGLAGHFL